MEKIKLPPCAVADPTKCGECGRFDTCEDYVPAGGFDALAEAVKNAGLIIALEGPREWANFETRKLTLGYGITFLRKNETTGKVEIMIRKVDLIPTLALLAAIIAYNELCDKDANDV